MLWDVLPVSDLVGLPEFDGLVDNEALGIGAGVLEREVDRVIEDVGDEDEENEELDEGVKDGVEKGVRETDGVREVLSDTVTLDDKEGSDVEVAVARLAEVEGVEVVN